jgi:hypothetical protein
LGPSNGFVIERADVMTRSAWLDADGQHHYRSLCLGHERLGKTAPKRLLAEVPAPDPAKQAAMLVEVGVFVFVARRLD